MAMVHVSINLIYDVKDGVDTDAAVAAVTTNLQQLMYFAGIENGKQGNDGAPLFYPPTLRELVDLTLVKHLMVISDGD
jgi:hypothetical protein